MIRVVLPAHLRNLARVTGELKVDVAGPGGTELTLADFAGISAEGVFLNKKHTYSYGAQAVHVTVDARIGEVRIVDYVAVVDCGRIINPTTLRGQVIGSLVQGLGGALLENLAYDGEGQLMTGSLADYLLPSASDFPAIQAMSRSAYRPLLEAGVRVFEQVKGDKALAGRMLGISRATLYRKLKRYNISGGTSDSSAHTLQ